MSPKLNKNYPKDAVAVQELADAFKDVCKKQGQVGFDLKEYNGLWDSCASRPCLADLDHLVDALLIVSPSLNAGHGAISQALGSAFAEFSFDKLDPKRIAAKLLVVQKHTRGLKFGQDAPKKLAGLKAKMTSSQIRKIDKVLAKLQPLRELKKVPSAASDMSVDEYGLPTWSFVQPVTSPSGASASVTVSMSAKGDPARDDDLSKPAVHMSLSKKPAASKEPRNHEDEEGDDLLKLPHADGIYKPPLKRPASSKESPMKVVKAMKKSTFKLDPDEVIRGPFKVHGPFMKTGKSYITSDGSHVVTITRQQSASYHEQILQIMGWLNKQKKVTRRQAKAKREQILGL